MGIGKVVSRSFGRIGLLMGGPSSEREISLRSGKAVLEALKQLELDVTPIDIKTDSVEENIRLLEPVKLDCAFLALHGRFGEDGSIQEILERLSIRYTGSGVAASRLAMDKISSRELFESRGLHVPRYEVLEKATFNGSEKPSLKLGLPLVIKPASHGSSIGLSIVHEEEEVKKALELAFTFDERILVEEYIKGREMTVGILDEQALPVIEIIPKNPFFDYEAKYQKGLTEYVVPARLEEFLAKEISLASLSAHRALGCRGCSRVDLILNEAREPVVLEVNTIPGLTATSLLPKAAKFIGIEFPELCLHLIRLAYEKE